MNSGPLLFLGLFCTMAVSWLSFVLGPQLQIGGLEQGQVMTSNGPEDSKYPNLRAGQAIQGAEVYRANGCVACHTQQVRPREMGSDLDRGWGTHTRYSVALDYIFDRTVQLGSQRVGPDLANAGLRMDTSTVLMRLYAPDKIAGGRTIMPPYRYLFEKRKVGQNPSIDALPVNVEPGWEIIPRPEAISLAAYVASLRQDVYLFEAPPPFKPATNSVNTTATNAVNTNVPAK